MSEFTNQDYLKMLHYTANALRPTVKMMEAARELSAALGQAQEAWQGISRPVYLSLEKHSVAHEDARPVLILPTPSAEHKEGE